LKNPAWPKCEIPIAPNKQEMAIEDLALVTMTFRIKERRAHNDVPDLSRRAASSLSGLKPFGQKPTKTDHSGPFAEK
jgi:hypothetical protein